MAVLSLKAISCIFYSYPEYFFSIRNKGIGLQSRALLAEIKDDYVMEKGNITGQSCASAEIQVVEAFITTTVLKDLTFLFGRHM